MTEAEVEVDVKSKEVKKLRADSCFKEMGSKWEKKIYDWHLRHEWVHIRVILGLILDYLFISKN